MLDNLIGAPGYNSLELIFGQHLVSSLHITPPSLKKIKHLKQKSNMACKQQKRMQRTQDKSKKLKNTKLLDKNN